MKKLIVIILCFTAFTSQAQFGGLLKKAKDKVSEKPVDTQPKNGGRATGSQGNDSPIPIANASKTLSANSNVEFEMPYNGYYGNGAGSYTAEFYKRNNSSFSPYEKIRKKGETGVLHFAKDYPELADITRPEIANLKIEFSTAPYENGKGTTATEFNSTGFVYAKISTTTGTIKDALKIKDKDKGVQFRFELYDDENQKIVEQSESGNFFIFTTAQMNRNFITVDVLPDTKRYFQGKQGDVWLSRFSYAHTQEVFKRSGKYKVGVYFSHKQTDEWGKEIDGKEDEFGGLFNYEFFVKDADEIVKAGQEIYGVLKNAETNAIKPLAEEWKLKSNPINTGYTQAQLISLFKSAFSTQLEPHTVVKFYASPESGWYVDKNQSGYPNFKAAHQWYTVFIKFKNTERCFFQRFALQQDYAGGGTYNTTRAIVHPYSICDCTEMK